MVSCRAAPPMPECRTCTLNTPVGYRTMQRCGLGVNLPGAASGVVNAYRAGRAPIAPIQWPSHRRYPTSFRLRALALLSQYPSLVQYFCQPWYCYLFHQCHNRWNLLWSRQMDMTVTINPMPTAAFSVAESSGTTNNDGIICNGASVNPKCIRRYPLIRGQYVLNAMDGKPASLLHCYRNRLTQMVCTDTETTSITVNPLPAVNAGMYPALCVNQL